MNQQMDAIPVLMDIVEDDAHGTGDRHRSHDAVPGRAGGASHRRDPRACRRARAQRLPRNGGAAARAGVGPPAFAAAGADLRRRRRTLPRTRPRQLKRPMDKSYSPRDIESRLYAAWEDAGWFAPGGDRRALLHHDPAAERDRHAAHGARVPAHADGRAHAAAPDGGRPHALAAGHRPRGYRHADGGRTPVECAGPLAAGPGPRGIRRTGLAVEGTVGRHHQPADAPPRQLGGLVARSLHHGRGAFGRGRRSVRAGSSKRA